MFFNHIIEKLKHQPKILFLIDGIGAMLSVILLFFIVLTGLFTSFKAHQSLIKYNFFYFILYLCALEIAPYIILYKVIISK